jgi:translation initiation factor IF-2
MYVDVIKDVMAYYRSSYDKLTLVKINNKSQDRTIESLQTRILNLEDKLADNEINAKDYFRIKMRYENDIMELKNQKSILFLKTF